jgi:4-alpha-glucanotransferase
MPVGDRSTGADARRDVDASGPIASTPATRYHLYAQWQCHEQMRCLAERCNDAGAGLYLDLPVGAPPDSFDAWLNRDHFVDGCIAGAPPDGFFEHGQTWGFRPLRPDVARASGHAYWAACVRHHMAVSRILRVDHVMGLHRMYCVPDGFAPHEGVYLRYPADEMYAVLALESARTGCAVVGEDLGTVPASVRAAMKRHGVLRTHVVQGDVTPAGTGDLPLPPADSLACLGTHDMPPFAAYWTRALGTDDPQDARVREATMVAMRDALGALGASPARLLQVNLDDLWGETEAHNVPGTHGERANWSLRARYPWERIREMDVVVETLAQVDRARRACTEEDDG